MLIYCKRVSELSNIILNRETEVEKEKIAGADVADKSEYSPVCSHKNSNLLD